jgi:hypothetical protein
MLIGDENYLLKHISLENYIFQYHFQQIKDFYNF